jgi:hypothetical protein
LDGLWTASAYDTDVETERFEHTFLVRTWCESRDATARAEWRGSVEHLATKERRYFRDFADLCAFILTHQLTGNPENSMRAIE